MNKNTNSNSFDVNSTMDESLLRVANIEAATDIVIEGDQLTKAAKYSAGLAAEFADDANLLLEEGVTDNAPYSNTSDYKMVEYSLETDKSDKNIQNYQSS